MGHLVYCFGGTYIGRDENNAVRELWTKKMFMLNLQRSEWTQLPITILQPFLRAFHHTLLVGDSLLIIGGKNEVADESPVTSCLTYNLLLKKLENFEYEGIGGLDLVDNCIEYIEVNNEVVTFGGQERNGDSSNKVDAMSLRSRKWRSPVVKGAPPPPRSGHSSCLFYTTMFIWGGLNDNTLASMNDLSILEVRNEPFRWSHPILTGPEPVARYRSSLNYVNGRLFIFGGNTRSGGRANGMTDRVDVINMEKREYCTIAEVGVAGTDPDVLAINGIMPEMALHTSFVHPEGIAILGGGAHRCDIMHVLSPTKR